MHLSVVTPMFNESGGIENFLDLLFVELKNAQLPSYEVILVDDKSTDDSFEKAKATGHPGLIVVKLSGNVGHQRAIEAGIEESTGDWIVTMDSDGEHPPSVIKEMLDTAVKEHVGVVYGVRKDRNADPRVKKWLALAYYSFTRKITGIQLQDSQADFRLISRDVAELTKQVRGDKILRVLIPALNLDSATVSFKPELRISGSSRYRLNHQVSMAFTSILAFSSKPLRLTGVLGATISLASLLWLIYVLVIYLKDGTVAGWTSVMFAVLFLGGLNLFAISLVGLYVSQAHDMLMNKPRFSIDKIWTNALQPDVE